MQIAAFQAVVIRELGEACLFYAKIGYTPTETEMESDEYEVQCFMKEL